jgi:Outer membrane protein beta-barrel family/Carboxypeptidase regulatory-like domain
MYKKLSLIIAFCFFASLAFAQTIQVSGNVKDTATKVSVKNAVVTLLTPKDSILKAFTRVKEDGSYSLSNVKPGKYIISVSHPTFGEYVDDIELKLNNETLGMIALTPKSKLLEAVIVKTGSPIRIKGDTTIYTADSFKVSANANVEELLKKLPGIQVDKDGKIKAMGQNVEKVLVDGEEFFGDDPGMAVKNLRADAVKEVQVFDKKSEQAEFTGIDDGKTKKTINLKLKEDKKKGYFGKADIAGGLLKDKDARYNDNLMVSSFKGKRKLSAFLLNGNTGQDGLNWQDEQKFGGSDNDNMSMVDDEGGFSFFNRNGSQDEEPNIDPQNGFTTNVNAGAQYSNKWNDKTNLNFSPKYNSQRYNNTKTQYTQTQIKDTSLNNNTNENVFINRSNVKLKAIYDVKLDSANTLKITAKSNFYETKTNTISNGTTTGFNGILANGFNKNLSTNSNKEAYGINAVFKHKFKKARRTLSFTADWNVLNNAGKNNLISSNTIVKRGIPFGIDINQQKDFDKTTSNVSTKIVYTEPLNKKFAMEFAYQISLNHGTNDQTTLNYDSTISKYNNKVDTLSNKFRQNIIQHTPSAKLNYAHKKFKVNIGAGISVINFDLKDLSSSYLANRSYTNFNPSANMTYTYKSNHSLTINYSGTTKQPTIEQLQPLRNNNDQINLYIGNPDLKPSFTNRFSLNHYGYNFVKDLWHYQSMSLNLENNSIANNRIYKDGGSSSTTQPINTNGNINLNFFGGVGFKQKKLNTRFGINFNTGFNRYVDFIDNAKSNSDNTNIGINLSAQKSKDKKYDFSVSVGPNYNMQTTSQNKTKNQYVTNNIGFNGTVYFKKVWSINADYDLFTRQKTAQAPSLTNNILNARIQRTFNKDEFTVYFLVRDILKQNIGLDRNFFGNTFTETRNDRLQQYWMLGFAWNFKNKPVAKK